MFLLNLIMAITGYIFWGIIGLCAVLYAGVALWSWLVHGESMGDKLNREVDETVGTRRLSLFEDDFPDHSEKGR